MQFQAKILIFIVSACSLWSIVSAACPDVQCYNCSLCNNDCTKIVEQDCDSDCLVKVRKFLCHMENEHCNQVRGCNVPPVNVTLYPAKDYDVSQPAYQPETIQARKNCCYTLTGQYDNTLSAVKISPAGSCVQFFDNSDCTGPSITIDSSYSSECLSWIDCTPQTAAPPTGLGRIKFNDKASSFKLC